MPKKMSPKDIAKYRTRIKLERAFQMPFLSTEKEHFAKRLNLVGRTVIRIGNVWYFPQYFDEDQEFFK